MELTAVLTTADDGGYVALNPETVTAIQGETVEEAGVFVRMLGDGRLGLVDVRIELGPVLEGAFDKCAQRPRQALCERRSGLGR